MQLRWVFLLLTVVVAGCDVSADRSPARSVSKSEIERQAKEGAYALISVGDLESRVSQRENMILIDASPEAVFRRGHILGSTHYLFPDDANLDRPWDEVDFGGPAADDFARTLGDDKSVPVVVYAENDGSFRSHQAASWAKRLGFSKVERFAGGLAAWKDAGYETRSIKD